MHLSKIGIVKIVKVLILLNFIRPLFFIKKINGVKKTNVFKHYKSGNKTLVAMVAVL